jgi:hypothetical protein
MPEGREAGGGRFGKVGLNHLLKGCHYIAEVVPRGKSIPPTMSPDGADI